MNIFENKSQLLPQSQPRIENVKSVFFNIGKRTLDRENPFKSYQHDENMKLSVSKLSDEQVRTSQMYAELVQKIEQMVQAKENSEVEHQHRLKWINQEIISRKEKIHECKFNVWEIKNQIMALEEELANEVQQSHEIDMWMNGEAEGEGDQNQYGEGSEEEREYDDGVYGQQEENEAEEVQSLESRGLLNQISVSCSDI